MSNNWNNRLPRIFAFPWIMVPFLSEKNNDRLCYYLKKYGILHTFHIILISVILNGRCHGNIKFWSNYLTIAQTIIPSNICAFYITRRKQDEITTFLGGVSALDSQSGSPGFESLLTNRWICSSVVPRSTPWRMTPSSISIILQMIRKLNSMIVLLFI